MTAVSNADRDAVMQAREPGQEQNALDQFSVRAALRSSRC